MVGGGGWNGMGKETGWGGIGEREGGGRGAGEGNGGVWGEKKTNPLQ